MSKLCGSCGRPFNWRRKWARDWKQVRYCSERCRKRRLRPVDRKLERAVLHLLESRKGSICPSEAARAVSRSEWQQLMEPVRSAGRRLAAREIVVFQQGGKPVNPAEARGVVRLARGPAFRQEMLTRASLSPPTRPVLRD